MYVSADGQGVVLRLTSPTNCWYWWTTPRWSKRSRADPATYVAHRLGSVPLATGTLLRKPLATSAQCNAAKAPPARVRNRIQGQGFPR